MSLHRITAIVRREKLPAVEARMRQLGVPGLTIEEVRGLGEYANYYRPDVLVRHARVEIFADRGRCNDIVMGILESARSGAAGDGIVAVETVDEVYRVRTGRRLDSADP